METNKILNADILDLLFEGRNKEYGAYELRRHYNSRLGRAILGMTGVVAVLFCFGFVSKNRRVVTPPMMSDTVVLAQAPDVAPPPPPPPPRVPKPQPVATIRFVTTRIVPDKQVLKDVIPPENKDLEDAKIGTVNTDGVKDAGVDVAPPLNSGTGNVVTAPKPDEDDGRPFTKVEIDASFPGGPAAWLRFLNQNLRFPDEAIAQGLDGTVVVRFVVDKDGKVSDIEVVSGPETGGIREEVVRVLRKSGKWIPAVQNGRYVKAYKMQPVTFHIEAQ